MALSESDFELLSVTLAPSDKHGLRQSRFLLQQQLGQLSGVRSVKSAQVAADEASKRLDYAKQDFEKKQRLAVEALQASYQQQERVAQLQIELDTAVAKAKAALAEEAAPKPKVEPPRDSGKLAEHAQQLSTAVKGVELSEDILGPLRLLVSGLLGPQTSPVAAGEGDGDTLMGGASQAAEPGGGADVQAPKEGDNGTDTIDYATSETFQAAATEFIAADPEKRKFVEELQSRIKQKHEEAAAAKKQRLG